MPSKAVASRPKSRSATEHVSYQDMIIDAIVTLKERNGSSRVALKKYIKANNKNVVDGKMFDSLFNRALKSGVEKGIFAQPKGSSGGTKLAKKEQKPSTARPAVKNSDAKSSVEKKTVEKKPTKKTIASKKATSPKTESSSVKSKSVKSKSQSKIKKLPVKDASASEKPAVLSRTKSGRVTKSTPAEKKAPVKKKVTPKKATAKKSVA